METSESDLYKLIVLTLSVIAIMMDFMLVFSMIFSAIIMMVLIFPFIDVSEDYARMIREGNINEETGWKVMAVIVMFVTLTVMVHKQILTLFGHG